MLSFFSQGDEGLGDVLADMDDGGAGLCCPDDRLDEVFDCMRGFNDGFLEALGVAGGSRAGLDDVLTFALDDAAAAPPLLSAVADLPQEGINVDTSFAEDAPPDGGGGGGCGAGALGNDVPRADPCGMMDAPPLPAHGAPYGAVIPISAPASLARNAPYGYGAIMSTSAPPLQVKHLPLNGRFVPVSAPKLYGTVMPMPQFPAAYKALYNGPVSASAPNLPAPDSAVPLAALPACEAPDGVAPDSSSQDSAVVLDGPPARDAVLARKPATPSSASLGCSSSMSWETEYDLPLPARVVPRKKRSIRPVIRRNQQLPKWLLDDVDYVPPAPPQPPRDIIDSSGDTGGGGNNNGSTPPQQQQGPVVVRKRNRQRERECSHCGNTETPQWRAGPGGPGTLCNACGLRFKQHKLLEAYRPLTSPSFDSDRHSNRQRNVLKIMEKNTAGATAVHTYQQQQASDTQSF